MDTGDVLVYAIGAFFIYRTWKDLMPAKQKTVKRRFPDLPKILGARVKDEMSGFEGIASAYHIFLSGCNRVSVSPPCGDNNKFEEAMVFDESSLTILEEAEDDFEHIETKKKQSKKDLDRERGGPPVKEKRRGFA